MSDQARGRPVLRRVTAEEVPGIDPDGLWAFCGEYDGTERAAIDAAAAHHGDGVYKVFPSGSWAGGYLRD